MNVFIDCHGEPLVADFGSAITLCPSVESPPNRSFCLRWAPPEVLQTGQYDATEKVDVYSFACLCIEVTAPLAVPAKYVRLTRAV
jgi:serine/threonine protein kinase